MDECMKVEISLEDRYFIMLALNGRIKEYEELCRSAAYKAQSKEDFERVKTLRYFKNSYIRAYRAFEHAVNKAGDR